MAQIFKKQIVNGRFIDPNDTVFVLDSFDVVEHLKTKKKISSNKKQVNAGN